MYIETFKVFCDLAETGSFSKAARLNSVTQSAVSQQVRALEIRFRVTLVVRGGRKFSLTPEGAAFLGASREILGVYAHLADRLHTLRNVVGGELRIASIYSVGLHDLPPRLKRFRQAHPEVDIHVEYRRSSEVYAQVLAGSVDFGLVAFPAPQAGIAIDVFDDEELVLICHPGHPLAGRASIELSELAGEKLISFEPDLPTRRVIDRHLRRCGVDLDQTADFDNIETVKRAVEIESGISLVPRNTVHHEAACGALCVVPVREPKMLRPLAMISRRGRPCSPAQEAFRSTLLKKDSVLEKNSVCAA